MQRAAGASPSSRSTITCHSVTRPNCRWTATTARRLVRGLIRGVCKSRSQRRAKKGIKKESETRKQDRRGFGEREGSMQQKKANKTQCQTHATRRYYAQEDYNGSWGEPQKRGQRPIRPPQRAKSCKPESDLLPPSAGECDEWPAMRWCGNHHDRLTRVSLGGSLINVTISGSPIMSFDDADLHANRLCFSAWQQITMAKIWRRGKARLVAPVCVCVCVSRLDQTGLRWLIASA
ncbi:hypothetical protein GGI35DRAFT_290233 [Trichoderma velutinum]